MRHANFSRGPSHAAAIRAALADPAKREKIAAASRASWARRKISPLDRLRSKFEIAESGCWLWKGSVQGNGYGGFRLNGRYIGAHRAAFLLFKGGIPEDTELDHLCRNILCVNPEHMEPVSHRVNVERGRAGKINREKTHCPQGHAYAAENLYVYDNRRFCVACGRRAALRHYHSSKRV